MASEKQQPKSGPNLPQPKFFQPGRCPDHPNAEVKLTRKEVKTGYFEFTRKIMLVCTCQHPGCNRWGEVYLDYVLWS